jgi:hypothetical protein
MFSFMEKSQTYSSLKTSQWQGHVQCTPCTLRVRQGATGPERASCIHGFGRWWMDTSGKRKGRQHSGRLCRGLSVSSLG